MSSYYEMTVDQPNMPKGEVINIPGLGDFENGKTYEIDQDQHEAFRTFHGVNQEVRDDDGNVVRDDAGRARYEFVQGPTLIQANLTGVSVEYVKQSKKQSGSSDTNEGGDQ